MVVQAVNFGLDVIDQAFEKLDTNAGNSDSEDEESSYGVDPLFEAKVSEKFSLQINSIYYVDIFFIYSVRFFLLVYICYVPHIIFILYFNFHTHSYFVYTHTFCIKSNMKLK